MASAQDEDMETQEVQLRLVGDDCQSTDLEDHDIDYIVKLHSLRSSDRSITSIDATLLRELVDRINLYEENQGESQEQREGNGDLKEDNAQKGTGCTSLCIMYTRLSKLV